MKEDKTKLEINRLKTQLKKLEFEYYENIYSVIAGFTAIISIYVPLIISLLNTNKLNVWAMLFTCIIFLIILIILVLSTLRPKYHRIKSRYIKINDLYKELLK